MRSLTLLILVSTQKPDVFLHVLLNKVMNGTCGY